MQGPLRVSYDCTCFRSIMPIFCLSVVATLGTRLFDGSMFSSGFASINAMTSDSANNLYITDSNNVIRMIDTTNSLVHTLTGNYLGKCLHSF